MDSTRVALIGGNCDTSSSSVYLESKIIEIGKNEV